MARSRGARPARQGLGGGRGHQRPLGAVSPSGTLDAFVWRTPDERIAAPAEPDERIAAPAEPAPARALPAAPQAVEPERRAAPAQAAAVILAPRSGVIIDPATMPPDDPGPEERQTKRRGFQLYANE